jgi:hypothetical protein
MVLESDSAICSLPIKASMYDSCKSINEIIRITATAFFVKVVGHAL